MDKINVKCPAKINLFFNIVGQDNRGYHLVHALNQSVSLYDNLTILKKDLGINITCNNSMIPLDERNSVYKAAKLFLDKTGTNSGVSIHIDKNIPLEAGLGGESSDAAGVLVGLNELFGTKLSLLELSNIGYLVGCDVPFCIYGGSMRVSGCGEVIEPWDNPYENYLIVKPSYGFSTKEAFKKYDSTINNYTVLPEEIGHNDFHLILDNDTLKLIDDLKTKFKCISMLTGSGSSIICIFNDYKGLEGAFEFLKNNNKFEVFLTKSCSGILF